VAERDEQLRQPSYGALGALLPNGRGLRIFGFDAGHELTMLVQGSYVPKELPQAGVDQVGPTLASVSIRKPYTLEKIIAALEVLKADSGCP
jgi:hypothetical protein